MLYHFRSLDRFDNLEVNQESKNSAELEFKKKKIYYNMKIKALQRFFISLDKFLRSAKNLRCKKIDLAILELEKLKNLPQPQHAAVRNQAAELLGRKEAELDFLSESYERVYEEMEIMIERHIFFINKELESTGNLKLEEGGPEDRWYNSCINLVKSRFFPDDLKNYGKNRNNLGVKDIRVKRVLRIHNRFLRNRFEERIELYLDQSNPEYKKSFEFLFYGIDPLCPEEIWNVLENGYGTPEENEEKKVCPFAPLVNNVAAADSARVNSFRLQEENRLEEKSYNSELGKLGKPISSGKILVCKVIIVDPKQDSNSPHFRTGKSFTEQYQKFPIEKSLLEVIF